MKKTYQIEAQRAMSRLEEMAATGNPVVRMVLPMAEMVGYLRESATFNGKSGIPGETCAVSCRIRVSAEA